MCSPMFKLSARGHKCEVNPACTGEPGPDCYHPLDTPAKAEETGAGTPEKEEATQGVESADVPPEVVTPKQQPQPWGVESAGVPPEVMVTPEWPQQQPWGVESANVPPEVAVTPERQQQQPWGVESAGVPPEVLTAEAAAASLQQKLDAQAASGGAAVAPKPLPAVAPHPDATETDTETGVPVVTLKSVGAAITVSVEPPGAGVPHVFVDNRAFFLPELPEGSGTFSKDLTTEGVADEAVASLSLHADSASTDRVAFELHYVGNIDAVAVATSYQFIYIGAGLPCVLPCFPHTERVSSAETSARVIRSEVVLSPSDLRLSSLPQI